MTTTAAALLDRLFPTGPSHPPSLRATNWLLTHGMPSPRDEAWRYSPVGEILARLEASTSAPPGPMTRAEIDRLAGSHGPNRIVLVNGVYVPALSDVGVRDAGTSVGRLSELPPGTVSTSVPVGDPFTDGFQALSRVAGGDPAVVALEADVRHDGPAPAPIHVVHVSVPGPEPQICHPRTQIEVGARSHLRLIETFTGLPGSTLTNSCTAIRLHSGASLHHQRVQSEAAGATHIGHTQVWQAAGARYQASSIMLGADIARHATDVTLYEPGAHVALTGIYRPTDQQRHDIAVCVDHAASRGTSTQEFKGIVDDHARGSFSGRIIVRPDTVANDAQQLNRNLVLKPTAQANSRPWLEIFADDVRCTHGATVGRLDDDALFYLRSRGISLDESRTMLIDAFADEITDAIEPASLRAHVAALVDAARPGRRP